MKDKALQLVDSKIQELKERKENSLCKTTRSRINFAITQFKEVFWEIEKS